MGVIISGLPESRLLSNYHVIVTPNWLRIIISVLFQVNAEVSANESEKSVYFQNKVLGEGDSFPWYIGQHSFFKALNDLWWQKRQRKKSQFNKRFPNRSPAQVGCMRQALGPGALGRPRGIGWRGKWEGGSGWGTHVNPWLFHFNVWQNPLQ